jgi:hypothetical protein
LSSFFGSYSEKKQLEPTPMEDDNVPDSSLQGTPPSSPAKKKPTDGSTGTRPRNPGYLELDSLNANPCMPMILQVENFYACSLSTLLTQAFR